MRRLTECLDVLAKEFDHSQLRDEILLEIAPPSQGGKKLAVHFPRLGFNVTVPKARGDKAKL